MGEIYIISGFSGSGKGTLVERLLETRKDVEVVKSCTTRKARFDNEFYTFLTEEQFDDMERKGLLLESNEYNGKKYGTPIKEVERIIYEGKSVLLEIDVHGRDQVFSSRAFSPDQRHCIFVVVEAETLYKRLLGRGTETIENIILRLETALRESEFIEKYDCVICNDDLEQTVVNLGKYIEHRECANVKKSFDVEKFRRETEVIIERLKEEVNK